MRISLHDYVTDPLLPQKDGVNLAHENIATLLRHSHEQGLEVAFHDFNRLLGDDAYARKTLDGVHCVISNVGPHAHYYFYLREKLGLDFRIIRDVRTAIWSSYLFQEYLCAPYLRPSDLLMVASHYTRGIYEKLFPHLASYTTFRCYPLTVCFPETPPARPVAGDTLTLGYVGRLSEDKNFPDLVELLITLNREYPGRYKLLACGDVHSPSCDPDTLRRHIANHLGNGDFFEYLPARANGQIWELYGRFDLMVFPSTSNLETLGRVLIEASYAGVPVICGAHAAAPELMPAASLCRVSYLHNESFSSHYDHSLGRIDIADMARAVTSGRLMPPSCHLDYQSHPEKYLAVLRTACSRQMLAGENFSLHPAQRAFIDALEASLPPPLSTAEADELIANLIPWFIGVQNKEYPERPQLLSRLLALSRHPERTQRFIAKAEATRGDFTNVGGIDIELCHVAGFYPEFRLASEFASGPWEDLSDCITLNNDDAVLPARQEN